MLIRLLSNFDRAEEALYDSAAVLAAAAAGAWSGAPDPMSFEG
jgi:predicted RNA polymerase sigma factor